MAMTAFAPFPGEVTECSSAYGQWRFFDEMLESYHNHRGEHKADVPPRAATCTEGSIEFTVCSNEEITKMMCSGPSMVVRIVTEKLELVPQYPNNAPLTAIRVAFPESPSNYSDITFAVLESRCAVQFPTDHTDRM